MYKSLIPLLSNELKMMNAETVIKLTKICNYLAAIENRAFLLLGTFPLTFGSMTSVSRQSNLTRLKFENEIKL